MTTSITKKPPQARAALSQSNSAAPIVCPGNTRVNGVLDAALSLAELGYAVFPCNPDKTPGTTHGFLDASSDPEVITGWWTARPNALIGLATSGLVVIDIDPLDGKQNLWPNADDLRLSLADAPTAITPRGGCHRFFRRPEGATWTCTAGKIAPGVDIRTDGGYVIVPPSSGAKGPYCWQPTLALDVPLAQLSEPPRWLCDLLDATNTKQPTPRKDSAPEAVITEGSRNATLTHLAGVMRRRGMTSDEILAAIQVVNRGRCSPPLSDEEVRRIAESVSRYAPAVTPDTWVPFPTETLPPVMRDFVKAAAGAIGCDQSYLALPCLVAAAGAIGNTHCIRLKNSWREPSVIWAAIVGESGAKKTPAFNAALQPIRDIERQAREDHKRAVAEFNARLAEDPNRSKAKSEGPVCSRYLCGDITVEALAVLLDNQPRGLIVARDELAGLIGSFDAYKARGARADSSNWLSAWNAGPFQVDRKTGDAKRAMYIPHAAVSLVGGIQPGILRRVLGCEHIEDGFAARLLMAMPPRRATRWTDAGIDPEIAEAWNAAIHNLYALDFAYALDGRPFDRPVELSPKAREVWIAYYNDHAQEQAQLSGDLAAVGSKLEAYTARLALVFHLIRKASGEAVGDQIDVEDVQRGVAVSRWFGNEARRVYAMLNEEADDGKPDNPLPPLIARLGGSVTARHLQRHCNRFKTADDADRALRDLVSGGHGHWIIPPSGDNGRPPDRRFVLGAETPVDKTPENSRKPAVSSLVNAQENDAMPLDAPADGEQTPAWMDAGIELRGDGEVFEL